MKILVLLLATLAAVNAMENFFTMGGNYADEMGVEGNGCCLPTQWEGRVGSVHVTKRFLRPKVTASDSKVGFDYNGKKVAVRSMYYCPITKKIYETRTVVDFNAQKAYFIFKDKCKTFNYKRPLVKPCIPDFFKQFSPYFYGASTSSLALTPYGFRNGSLSVFSVVTKDSCVPIKGAYMLKRGRLTNIGKYQYYNITAGNTDRDLYNVPTSCNGANVTRYETRGLWRKFQKAVGYDTYEPFNPESQFGSLMQNDSMSQLMDVIDNNVKLLLDVQQKPQSVGDRWYQKGWDRVESRLRQYRDST